jgi:CheY-like chemotaxis protein
LATKRMTEPKSAPGPDDDLINERAALAHQLNNALAVILGNAQVAMLETTQPKVSEHLQEILSAGQRARDLIRRVLTLPPAAHQSGTHQLSLEELRYAASLRPAQTRILYIDDEEPLVLLAIRHLKRLGYQVTGATCAEDALEAFRKEPKAFAAVMTDLNMPGMSGLNLAKQVLAIRSDVPVIVASGFVSDELRSEAEAAGVRHVVYKPSTVEELAEVVHQILAVESK